MSLDHEEQYFINELADKRKAVRFALEERAREAASRASLAGALSVDDEEVIERVRALGPRALLPEAIQHEMLASWLAREEEHDRGVEARAALRLGEPCAHAQGSCSRVPW